MSQRTKATARRYFDEIINKRNLDVIAEVFAADYLEHDPANAEDTRGREGVRREVSNTLAAFSDLEETVEDLLGEGDRVMVRWTMRGLHDGEFMGVAPTYRRIDIPGMVVFRFAGDRIQEAWWNWDTLGLLRQLDVRPAAQRG
jgi:steroid delta-isomerase-like uncharacterized protein